MTKEQSLAVRICAIQKLIEEARAVNNKTMLRGACNALDAAIEARAQLRRAAFHIVN